MDIFKDIERDGNQLRWNANGVTGPWVKVPEFATTFELVEKQTVALREVYHRIPQDTIDEFHVYITEYDRHTRDAGHDFVNWNRRRIIWARDVLGIVVGVSDKGTITHLRKELDELEKEIPGGEGAVSEIVDILFLAFQLVTIHGLTFSGLVSKLEEKLEINIARQWIIHDPSKPNEHERSEIVHEGDTAEPVG